MIDMFYGITEDNDKFFFIEFSDSDYRLWSFMFHRGFIQEETTVKISNEFKKVKLKTDNDYIKFYAKLKRSERSELVNRAIKHCEKMLGGRHDYLSLFH